MVIEYLVGNYGNWKNMFKKVDMIEKKNIMGPNGS